MLKLVNIKKDYEMKGSSVHALKGITLNFRYSEFVSILGPSGCGKTTLLNILGGLDHYTSGDLIIEGRSTKDYKDHDWDIYRNHRIGFVFQSYNLIPHENIQDNVELALTISGISKEERARRAREALDKVGLKDLYRKMPNQLSGGQCQRVAIARALVNEPEILLADEPTGALDSVTSVQIMDLIKEISKERLVIMVTHNPDLAYKYSTRIVKLLDGELQDDSNPYSDKDEKMERTGGKIVKHIKYGSKEDEKQVDQLKEEDYRFYGESAHLSKYLKQSGYTNNKKKDDDGYDIVETIPPHVSSKQNIEDEKAKMSWWTAFKLSAKNLWSKAKRTFMIIVAASIGIVGVSAVLSIRDGVTNYIVSMQDEMLSGNPISVSESSFDLSSILSNMSTSSQSNIVMEAAKDGYVNVDYVTERLIESAKTMGTAMIENEITQEYVDFINAMPEKYSSDVVMRYGIDISNNIYTAETRDNPSVPGDSTEQFTETLSLSAIRSIATSILNTKLTEANYSSYSSMIQSYTGTFSQSLNSSDYLLSQYDIVNGKIAQEADEIMIVLDNNEAITDFMLTLLGYYSQEDFLNVVYHYNTDEDGNHDSHWNEEREAAFQENRQYAISKLMDKRFVYYPNDSIYTSQSDPTSPFTYSYKEDTSWENGVELKVVGVLKPKENRQYTSLDSGFFYTPKFTQKFLKDNSESEITKYVRDTEDAITSKTAGSLQSGEYRGIRMGVYYNYDYKLEGKIYKDNYAYLGTTDSSLTSLISAFMGGGGSVNKITSRQLGGETLPNSIRFYPTSFDDKYLVTDYLDTWNSKDDITVNGKVLKASDRDEIKYTDNLSVIISMVNSIIDIISVALISFTALSLIVSTVMIGIITYVSVMERIKEIGVIRALGGRKKDVSHLFNAETFIIGFLSGTFGILITYIIQFVLNTIIHANFPTISAIAALPIPSALIVILISILLTVIAGFIPSRSAARKDPVVALRTE
jgi:putative ABC transport system permease protein